MESAVDLAEKLSAFSDLWSPKIVARLLIEPRGTVNTGDAGGPLTTTKEAI